MIMLLILPMSLTAAIPRYSTNPHDFVSSHLGHFWVNGQPLRFVGFNMRGFNYYGFKSLTVSATATDKITNMATMQQWGAKVARVYIPQCGASMSEVETQLDLALSVAAAHNVRLICCLTDIYVVSGFYPKGDHVYYSGGLLSESWYHTNYKVIYKPMVLQMVNRFKNDPTVFCWQLGNELKCPWEFNSPGNDLLPFSQDMASAIRAIDPNHMISLGTAGTKYAYLDDQEARDVYANFDFLTVHTYDGNDSEASDATLASQLGKPLLISEAGFDGSAYNSTTRAQATDADIAKWIGRGARGYMNWAFCALNRVTGDCEYYGVDYASHGTTDWNNYKAVYTKWANTLSSTPRPAPEKSLRVQASDGTYTDRVTVTWDEAWAANEYCVYRSELPPADGGEINVMPYALSYVECGHCNTGSTAQHMYDSDLSTRWCCAHNGSSTSGDHIVDFDLGSTTAVSKFVIKHASSSGTDPVSLNTNLFYIYSGTSINGPWTQEFLVYNPQMLSSHTLALSVPKDIRYLRLRILKPNPSADYVVRIPEFEVWGVPSAGLTKRISDWQTSRSFTDTTAIPGVTYLYSVNARNEAGESGASSSDAGFAAALNPIFTGQTKDLADGSSVYVTGGVVSAVYNGRFYLEQPDRTGGIMVVWSGTVAEGSRVDVAGTMATVDGERRVVASGVNAAE